MERTASPNYNQTVTTFTFQGAHTKLPVLVQNYLWSRKPLISLPIPGEPYKNNSDQFQTVVAPLAD